VMAIAFVSSMLQGQPTPATHIGEIVQFQHMSVCELSKDP